MITYQSQQFKEEDIAKVYIAFDAYGIVLKQYDVNAAGRTIRESIVQPSQFMVDAVNAALSLHNQAFKQIQVK